MSQICLTHFVRIAIVFQVLKCNVCARHFESAGHRLCKYFSEKLYVVLPRQLSENVMTIHGSLQKYHGVFGFPPSREWLWSMPRHHGHSREGGNLLRRFQMWYVISKTSHDLKLAKNVPSFNRKRSLSRLSSFFINSPYAKTRMLSRLPRSGSGIVETLCPPTPHVPRREALGRRDIGSNGVCDNTVTAPRWKEFCVRWLINYAVPIVVKLVARH
jgi:hypothetical protein